MPKCHEVISTYSPFSKMSKINCLILVTNLVYIPHNLIEVKKNISALITYKSLRFALEVPCQFLETKDATAPRVRPVALAICLLDLPSAFI